MIKYTFNDSGIFYVSFIDMVSLNDIEVYLSEFERLDYLPGDVLLLYDLREAQLNLKFKDIFHISKIAKKVTSTYTSVRTAFLVNKPKLTAYSLLFTRDLVPAKTVRRVFSTEEAALKWLN